MKKKTHGGKRLGSGRPKGEETVVITFRVPKKKKKVLKALIKQYLKKLLNP